MGKQQKQQQQKGRRERIRGKGPVDERSFEDLPPRHRRFVELYLQGTPPSEAARKVGYNPGYGRRLITLPHIKRIIAEEQRGIRQELQEAVRSRAERALLTLDELMDSASDNVRFRAAAFLWEQAMGKAKGVREVKHIVSGSVSFLLKEAQEELGKWREQQYIDIESQSQSQSQSFRPQTQVLTPFPAGTNLRRESAASMNGDSDDDGDEAAVADDNQLELEQ